MVRKAEQISEEAAAAAEQAPDERTSKRLWKIAAWALQIARTGERLGQEQDDGG